MSDLNSIIRKHVLKNAYDYGKPNPGSVVGKVIAEFPECKNDMKSTMSTINSEIKNISKLTKEEIENEMQKFKYYVKEEKEKTIELPNAKQGEVTTRFPPEPSGYPHIGHAKAVWLNQEGAKAYDGQLILRFDDTNPEKELQQFVDAIRSDLKWLGISWKKETYTSDNMVKIYQTAEELIKKDKAYVSTASREQLSDSRTTSNPLADRSLPNEEHLKRWQKMLSGDYTQGEALLLFKGDLKSQNTVMRDPALARIIEKEHYRQGDKYHVWPGYDLAVVVMDHIEGISHPMRSKEYELRDELYYALFDALNWKRPTMIPFSRLAIKRAPISKRLLTPLVNEKKVIGWDDPRLPTIAGLRRRGILQDAIKQFVLSFGLSKVDSEPDWEVLLAFNRKLLDPETPHYFFVSDPIKLKVNGLEEKEIELSLHPKKDLGNRKISASSILYISADDAKKLEKNEIFRLKDLCNVRLIKKGKTFEGELVPDEMVQKKIQWVSGIDKVECKILVPKDLLDEKGEYDKKSMQILEGYCETNCLKLDDGTMVQFERFGFCKLDKKKPLTFIFSC